MRYSKVFPRLQMIFQDLPDHHFLLCLSSLQSPNGSRRVPRHRGTLATGFGWQHSEFTHLSGDIPWVTYTLYIYHYHYPYIYILHGSFTPFFFPSPAGVQELTMNNQDLKVVISVVTCLLFVQADDAVWRWLDTWSSFLLERRVFCGLIDIDIDIVIM